MRKTFGREHRKARPESAPIVVLTDCGISLCKRLQLGTKLCVLYLGVAVCTELFQRGACELIHNQTIVIYDVQPGVTSAL